MLSAIRRRLTFTNVAVTVALLFAMTGGAYAAKKYVITSTKQISPSALKSLQGKAGAAGANGAQGAAGPAGPQGAAGAAGAKGDTGAAGKDGSAGAAGPAGVTGAKGDIGLKGGNGPAGVTGPAGVAGATGLAGPTCPGGECLLPVGATETGVWSFAVPKGVSRAYVSISFPLRLPAGPEPEFHYVTAQEQGMEGAVAEGCPSNVSFEAPKAAPGTLCVYEGLTLNNGEPPEEGGGADPRIGQNLRVLVIDETKSASGAGSWAVTR